MTRTHEYAESSRVSVSPNNVHLLATGFDPMATFYTLTPRTSLLKIVLFHKVDISPFRSLSLMRL